MASLKKAVEAKCKDCTYDPLDKGTWRDQVERCNVRSCALWPVRPMTVATITLNRKAKDGIVDGVDINAILADLDDEEEDDVPVATPVA